jgi:hypothetical protein
MYRSFKTPIAIAWIVSTILMSGCDDRATQIAREAADRQAQQNTAMAELNKEVASGTQRLVEADAQARKEVVGIHRDLQAERARLDTSWGDLEQERRQMAGERRTESLLAPTIQTVGVLAVVALVLGFCWYALVKVHDKDELECSVTNLLIEEVLVDDPQPRLANRERTPLLDQSPLDGSTPK